MSALNACLKVAKIAEASGAPYLENVANVAVVVFELLKQKGNNKKDVKELCESIADTIVVINDLVRMHGDQDTSCYIEICGEMETYLQRMAQDIKDFKLKHRGLRGVFCVDDFRDAIKSYRRRVNDLKNDFMIHSMGDCNSKVTQMHGLLMAQAVVHRPEESEDSKGRCKIAVSLVQDDGNPQFLFQLASSQLSQGYLYFECTDPSLVAVAFTIYIAVKMRWESMSVNILYPGVDDEAGGVERHIEAVRTDMVPYAWNILFRKGILIQSQAKYTDVEFRGNVVVLREKYLILPFERSGTRESLCNNGSSIPYQDVRLPVDLDNYALVNHIHLRMAFPRSLENAAENRQEELKNPRTMSLYVLAGGTSGSTIACAAVTTIMVASQSRRIRIQYYDDDVDKYKGLAQQRSPTISRDPHALVAPFAIVQ
ncbi:hypothetical protein EDD18DRAFT_1109490 [Armillaria luteobubalina]|uniref:Uncharacterized protein n=1 Tax=Armillaria luteobubalina TaxID=153913 RepID=A0AA39PWA5_9AGAR|nr:hypothetical protein EDD18DRAFT_1109490 [Armillaria luteobubalina]